MVALKTEESTFSDAEVAEVARMNEDVYKKLLAKYGDEVWGAGKGTEFLVLLGEDHSSNKVMNEVVRRYEASGCWSSVEWDGCIGFTLKR